MTTPAAASYAERFWNPPAAYPSVPAGASMAAAGDVETWTLAGGAALPAATEDTRHILRVFDTAMPLEVIRVIDHPAGSDTARVIRGDQDTAVTAHRPGFWLTACMSADGIAARQQAPAAGGTGVVVPSGVTATRTFGQTADPVTLVALTVPPYEFNSGAVYEAIAFGTLSITGAGNIAWAVTWTGTGIGGALGVPAPVTAPAPPTQTAKWRIRGYVAGYEGPTIGANLEMIIGVNSGQAVAVQPWQMGQTGTAGAGAGAALPRVFSLTAHFVTDPGPPVVPAAVGTITLQGGRASRIA